MPVTLAEWLLFAITGRVLVYVWFQFPLPPSWEWEANQRKYFVRFFTKLHQCDLCAGVWIYSFLAVVTGIDMSGIGSIVTMIATGILTSCAVHVFVLGWKEKFYPPQII
jgi:hypothetical protein